MSITRRFKNFINWVKCRLEKKEFWVSDYTDVQVLDVGCGDGTRVLQYGNTWSGVDTNAESIKAGQEKGANIFYGDATALPFKDEVFDMVLSNNVIEHLGIEDAHKHLREAARVLKKDGMLLLATAVPSHSFWGTFSHVKPYPPHALFKITTYVAHGENFERIPLKIEDVFYTGRFPQINIPVLPKICYALLTFVNNMPFLEGAFGGGYIMKLRKGKR